MFIRNITRMLALAGSLFAFSTITRAAEPDGVLPPPNGMDNARKGAVFTASNSVEGNRVLVYDRSPRGMLSYADSFPTGGLGTGGGLGNQSGLVLSYDGAWLFAVNAASSELSVFEVAHNVLVLRDVIPSGGKTPISVTVNHNLIYVLNAGGGGQPGNITAFILSAVEGRIAPLAGSTRPLSAADVGPAQIGFNPWGNMLTVTEKATNMVVTYTVGDNGLASMPNVQASNGMTPFGFAFDVWGRLIVSEAFGGAPGASAVSVYLADTSNGNLITQTSSEPTRQTAACWVAVVMKGHVTYAYTTNTGSGTITGFYLGDTGILSRLNYDTGVNASTGAGSSPIDLATTHDGKFMYSLNGVTNTITGFHVKMDGSLDPLGTITGIPAGANGLAAR